MKDKRTKKERHWAGRHSKECQTYLFEMCGIGCKYTRELTYPDYVREIIENLNKEKE